MAKKSQPTGKSLVIVESPAKAKTINRYLGSGYHVMASMGHVRDLPPHDLGIDIEQGFEPVYEVLAAKRKVINGLRKAAANAPKVYLATDLDREGEAIAWHLLQALDLDPNTARRVVFNQITKEAIQTAFANAHDLDMDKVNAQQARRLLDRIVGYQLSPLLQNKIGRGLSAGRVQSVAVRVIVDREQEIRAFVPVESWRIHGCFATDMDQAEKLAAEWAALLGKEGDAPTVKQRNNWLGQHGCFQGEIVTVDGKRFDPTDVADVRKLAEALGYITSSVDEQAWEAYPDKGLKTITFQGSTKLTAAPPLTVKDIQKRRTASKPNGPFTTASLQQAASSALGFAPSRTMRVAQQLYEGVDLGDADGPVGLITYMRTDSSHLSKESVETARELIRSDYGDKYLPAKPNVYGSAKRAQEAHEAIRPSDPTMTPDALRQQLTAEQHKLYGLIWRRFVACQMVPAAWDNTTVLIAAQTPVGEAVFKSTGRQLAFDGHLRVSGMADSGDTMLPPLEVDQPVAPLQIDPRQNYTSPPARFSEAALVKKLEAEGIGRPSTYAAIIQTVQDRGYVDLREKKLHPTWRGEIVTEKLVQHFPDIMDVKFTSYMEDELDKIEESHLDWVHVLGEFYDPFLKALQLAQVEMEHAKSEPSDHSCPECGEPMVYRHGKNGRFLSCSKYPDCKVARNVDDDGNPIAEIVADEPCQLCGKPMILRKSRLGPFLGCSGYPDCSSTLPSDENGVPLRRVEADDIKEKCVECGSDMSVKFARGKSFLGCGGYPKCKATSPLPPGVYVEKPKPVDAGVGCDKCGRPMVIRKSRRGPFLSCSGFPKCRNAMPTEKLDHLKALAAEGKIPDPPPEGTGTKKGGKKADVPRTPDGKVDYEAMGPPPPGFAWTRTGRPVVEIMPEEPLSCPDCGGELDLKKGRFGPYFGCLKYPKCRFVSNLRGAAKKQAEAENPTAVKPKPIPTDVPCATCGKNMVIRTGQTGPFLGCSGYPKCRNSQPLPEGATVESLAVPAGK